MDQTLEIATCRELAADEAMWVVVLAGWGKSFSAKAGLNWMRGREVD